MNKNYRMNLYRDQSENKHAGYGLFCSNFIKKHDIITLLNTPVYNSTYHVIPLIENSIPINNELHTIYDISKDGIILSSLNDYRGKYIDTANIKDNFHNKKEEPNAILYYDTIKDQLYLISIKDIEIGDEITINYGDNYWYYYILNLKNNVPIYWQMFYKKIGKLNKNIEKIYINNINHFLENNFTKKE